jgi:excisionase family DNA binding protein
MIMQFGGVAVERDDEWMTTREVAERLRVHEQSVRRWLRSGELSGLLVSDKGGWRIRVTDLEAFARNRGWRPQGEVPSGAS